MTLRELFFEKYDFPNDEPVRIWIKTETTEEGDFGMMLFEGNWREAKIFVTLSAFEFATIVREETNSDFTFDITIMYEGE